MTSYFLVELVAGPAWDPNRSRREQAGWTEHAAFMDRLVEDGFVVLGGPVGEGDGDHAILVVEADDVASVHLRLAPDPWDGTVLSAAASSPGSSGCDDPTRFPALPRRVSHPSPAGPVGACWGNGIHSPRPFRPSGQPPLPGHDELRPVDPRGRRARDHGCGARARHQLLRHGQRLRLRSAGVRAGEGKGSTEQIIGRWFAQGGGRRERTVLATKLYGDMGDWPNEAKLSALNIRRALDASLEAAADRLHRPLSVPPHRPRHAVGRDLAGDRRRDHRRARCSTSAAATSPAGISPRPRSAPRSAPDRPAQRAVDLQPDHPRHRARGASRPAQAYGLGIIPWSPLEGGLLGGVLRKQRDGKRRLEGRAADAVAAKRAQIEAYEDFAAELGHEPGDVALAWLLHQPARHRADRRPAHPGAARRRRPCARRSSSTRRRWPDSTRSSRATRPRPSTTPGRTPAGRRIPAPHNPPAR